MKNKKLKLGHKTCQICGVNHNDVYTWGLHYILYIFMQESLLSQKQLDKIIAERKKGLYNPICKNCIKTIIKDKLEKNASKRFIIFANGDPEQIVHHYELRQTLKDNHSSECERDYEEISVEDAIQYVLESY